MRAWFVLFKACRRATLSRTCLDVGKWMGEEGFAVDGVRNDDKVVERSLAASSR